MLILIRTCTAMASGEALVRVHGRAPLQFNYSNPIDNPSRKRQRVPPKIPRARTWAERMGVPALALKI
jgi:hypothetical protein